MHFRVTNVLLMRCASSRRWLATFVLAVLPIFAASGARLPLRLVESSFAEKPAALRQVIDGKDTGRVGWSVFPRTGEAHALIIATAQPIRAQAFDVTLCFLSGMPGRYFGDFALSYTLDPLPSLNGRWQRVHPQRFTATGTTLEIGEEGRLTAARSNSMIGDAIFQVQVPAPPQGVTGFRLDVFPFQCSDAPGLRVAWNEYKDFCLTEFRVEAIQTQTTNVALGRPVKASHPLWAGHSAAVLTDGLPGSFNHPEQSGLGSAFYFEIDLGVIRTLDHIVLRGRADGFATDRLSRVLIQLYDQPPGAGAAPVWQALHRADGSFPAVGEADVIHAGDGRGIFRGRYLRLSSDSPVALSPQLAEVEAYETITPRPISFKADGHALSLGNPLRVPAGSDVLTVRFEVPGGGFPERLPFRWRLRGLHEDWQLTRDLVAETAPLRPGNYRLEAQLGHTDGQWDHSVLSVPVRISAHFWQTPLFHWSGSGFVLLGGILFLRASARRREARRQQALEHQTALARERSRIARDMHDEVGCRLSQLALMQDLMLRQHPLPPEAQHSLRELAINTRQAVAALDQIVWAVNPLHDTLTGVAEHLASTATSYLTPLDVACRLDMPMDWPAVEVRAQVRHQLMLAFQEALQNVAKHSGADAVTLLIRYEAQDLLVQLEDNGRGLPPDTAGTGKDGLNNMRSRLEAIGGVFEIRNRPEGGTQVRMRAPIHPRVS